jgi:hypothetical protein
MTEREKAEIFPVDFELYDPKSEDHTQRLKEAEMVRDMYWAIALDPSDKAQEIVKDFNQWFNKFKEENPKFNSLKVYNLVAGSTPDSESSSIYIDTADHAIENFLKEIKFRIEKAIDNGEIDPI